MSEANCIHSNLPGGMGCVVCQSNAFRAHQQSLSGCRCIYGLWGEFLGTGNCALHGAKQDSLAVTRSSNES